MKFRFWVTAPVSPTEGELTIQYVNDKAHRMDTSRYQQATLSASAATLSSLAVAQLVQLEQRCLELMDEEELFPLRSETDRQRALAVLAKAHKTFLFMLEPVQGEHPLAASLASAKGVFMQRFLRLQQLLYRYPVADAAEDSMRPPPLYPGAERSHKRMRCLTPPEKPSNAVRMASVGPGHLAGISSSPLLGGTKC